MKALSAFLFLALIAPNIGDSHGLSQTAKGRIGGRVIKWDHDHLTGKLREQVPVPGTTIGLVSAGGTLTATSDARGQYDFSGLEPGKYTVGFTPPQGYIFNAATSVRRQPK